MNVLDLSVTTFLPHSKSYLANLNFLNFILNNCFIIKVIVISNHLLVIAISNRLLVTAIIGFIIIVLVITSKEHFHNCRYQSLLLHKESPQFFLLLALQYLFLNLQTHPFQHVSGNLNPQ